MDARPQRNTKGSARASSQFVFQGDKRIVEFHSADRLVELLAKSSRPLVFLVGSALTHTRDDTPSVPDVKGMVTAIRKYIEEIWGVTVGALDPVEAETALTSRLGEKLGERAFEKAGTLPRLVYRLCDAECGPLSDIKEKVDGLGEWGRLQFELWYDEKEDKGRRAVLSKVARNEQLTGADKKSADRLGERGLLVRDSESGPWRLNGQAWEDFVKACSSNRP